MDGFRYEFLGGPPLELFLGGCLAISDIDDCLRNLRRGYNFMGSPGWG